MTTSIKPTREEMIAEVQANPKKDRTCPKCHHVRAAEDYAVRGIGGSIASVLAICCPPPEYRPKPVSVRPHAIDRYIQRVETVSETEAEQRIIDVAVSGTVSETPPEWVYQHHERSGTAIYVTSTDGSIVLPLRTSTRYPQVLTVLTMSAVDVAQTFAHVSKEPALHLERDLSGVYLSSDEEFVSAEGVCQVAVTRNKHQEAFLDFRQDHPGADQIITAMVEWADQLQRPVYLTGPQTLLDRHRDTFIPQPQSLPLLVELIDDELMRPVEQGMIGYVPDGWEWHRFDLLHAATETPAWKVPYRANVSPSGRPSASSPRVQRMLPMAERYFEAVRARTR